MNEDTVNLKTPVKRRRRVVEKELIEEQPVSSNDNGSIESESLMEESMNDSGVKGDLGEVREGSSGVLGASGGGELDGMGGDSALSLVTATPKKYLTSTEKDLGGRPLLQDQITEARVGNALIKSYGVLTKAAKLLKCSQSNISQRIMKSVRLQEILMDARERVKDEVEYNYIKEVIKDPTLEHDEKERQLNWQKRKMYLKTQCKDRGYAEDKQPSREERPLQIIIQPAKAPEEKKAIEVQEAEYEDIEVVG